MIQKSAALLVIATALVGLQLQANTMTDSYNPVLAVERTQVASGPSTMSSEAGLSFDSINGGSRFASVALMGDLQDALFQFGARGLVPLKFNEEAKVFGVEFVSRWHFNRTVNRMYLEGLLTQHFYDQTNEDLFNAKYATLGLSYGYFRKVAQAIHVGGAVGVDYAPTQTALSNDSNLNTRLAFLANIDF